MEGIEGVSLHGDTPDDERGPSDRSAANSAGSKMAIATGCGEGEEQASPATAVDRAAGMERDQPAGAEMVRASQLVDARGIDGAPPGGGLASSTSFPEVFLSDDATLCDGVDVQDEIVDTANICSTESGQRQDISMLSTNARSVEETAVGGPTRSEETGAETPARQGVETSSHRVARDDEPRTRNKACQTRW